MQNHNKHEKITGFFKFLFYLKLSIEVPVYYLKRIKELGGIRNYFRFLFRALKFTFLFSRHKLLKVGQGQYKLDFYMPAYPSKAFYESMDAKLLHYPPRPISVVFSITKACSYKCGHCYQRLDRGADLDEDKMLKVAAEMRDLGICAFAVEGGEPLLKLPRLLKLMEVIKGAEVWVNSTGKGYTQETLELLKQAGVFGIMTSMHSVIPEEHDAFTGIAGSWQLSCDFIRDCRKAGLHTGFNTVLEEDAIIAGGIDKIMKLAKKLDCDFIQLIHAKPSGRWLGREVSSEKNTLAVKIARQAHVLYNSSAKKDYPILTAQVFEEQESMLGCTAGGIDRFYINANGEIQPCEFLNFSFGNVNNESFQTIYKRMRSFFPTPCTDWPCCSKAREINELITKNNLETTPIPWPLTKELFDNKKQCKATPIYKKLGIYK
jgi:radical SAM protein with 4Fe4S-binding SPASM domain